MRRPGVHLFVCGLLAYMMLLHFETIQRVEVACFIAVKRTSLLFGILHGVILFREMKAATRGAAGCVMIAGVALIAFAKWRFERPFLRGDSARTRILW